MRCHAESSDPFPFANCHIFSDSSLSWSVKYFMHGRKTFIKRHSVIQRRPQPKLFGCYSPIQELCLCWHLRLDTPCTWNRIVIVISKLLKRYSQAKRTRAPAYSRALRRIKGGFPKEGSREAQVRIPEYQEGTE